MASNDPVLHALVDLVEQLCYVGMEGKLAQAHANAMKVIRKRAGESAINAKAAAMQSWDAWRGRLDFYEGAPEMTRLRMAFEAGFLAASPTPQKSEG